MNNHTDVKRQTEETEESPPTRAENLVVSLKTVWAIMVLLATIGGFVLRLSFQVSALQEGMLSVNSKLLELDRVAKLEARLETLKENGSDSVKRLAADVSQLRHDFDVHVAETAPRPIK